MFDAIATQSTFSHRRSNDFDQSAVKAGWKTDHPRRMIRYNLMTNFLKDHMLPDYRLPP